MCPKPTRKNRGQEVGYHPKRKNAKKKKKKGIVGKPQSKPPLAVFISATHGPYFSYLVHVVWLLAW